MPCPSCGSSSFEQLDTDIRRCSKCMTLGSNYNFGGSASYTGSTLSFWWQVEAVVEAIAIMGLFMGGIPWLLFLIPIAIVGYPLYWLFLLIVWLVQVTPAFVVEQAQWAYPYVFGWWLK